MDIPDNYEELAEIEASGLAIQNEVMMRHLNGGVPVESVLDDLGVELQQAA